MGSGAYARVEPSNFDALKTEYLRLKDGGLTEDEIFDKIKILYSASVAADRSNLKLFCSKSYSSFAYVAAVLAGVSCEVEIVNSLDMTLKSGEDYATINPMGNFPALVRKDGSLLNQPAAILQYILDNVRIVIENYRRIPLTHDL